QDREAAKDDPIGFAAGVALSHEPLLEQVDEGEDQDPDQVNEVPKQAQYLDVVGVRLAGSSAGEGHQDVDGSGQNVRTVETGGDVKGVGVGALPKDQTLVNQAMAGREPKVLMKLPGEEPDPPERGERQEEHRLPAVALIGRGDREHHGDARADQQKRQKGG